MQIDVTFLGVTPDGLDRLAREYADARMSTTSRVDSRTINDRTVGAAEREQDNRRVIRES